MKVRQLGTWSHNIGHKLGIYTPSGERLLRLGAPTPGERPDQFNWCDVLLNIFPFYSNNLSPLAPRGLTLVKI